MQIFIDTAANLIHSFEDDVVVTNTNGVYSFKNADGTDIQTPTTLQPFVAPVFDPVAAAAKAKAKTVNQYAAALTKAIDAVAQTWQYDTVYTAATYLNSSIPQFAHEAAALVAWRDTAWNNAQVLLAEVDAGTAQMPATEHDFLTAVLPATPVRPA